MPPKLALVLCVLFVLWLFLRGRKRGQRLSPGLWIPVIWVLIVGSRPISVWLGLGGAAETTDNYLEGSPFDRLIFLLLIVAGLFVLTRRRMNWRRLIRNNQWLFAFFLYLGISALWSDYPFVSFKRWIKDIGNVIMVLVILTEADPVAAVRALFANCIYFLIPVSVLLVKYFPDLGRYYDRWTYLPSICGVTTGKNLLGMILFVSGLFLIWMLLTSRENRSRSDRNADLLPLAILSTMTLWLLSKSQSSTASTCTVLGGAILWGMRFPTFQRKAKYFVAYSLATFAALLVLDATFNLGQVLVQIVGRDMTFTGRTDIWRAVLKEHVNPVFGTGFYSFWLGNRIERLSRQYFFLLNEAHNAYLETYLNSGLTGLFLLVGLLASSAKKINREVLMGSSYAALRLAFFVSIVVYAMTESILNRLSPIWFVFLLVIMEYPLHNPSTQ